MMENMTPVDMLAKADLTEDQYRELETLAASAGDLVQPQFFRQRLRRVAHIVIVRTALREGATGGLYRQIAARYREEVSVLERAQKMVGHHSAAGAALVEPIAIRSGHLEFLEQLPSDARSKDELKIAASMLVEIFANHAHASRPISELSPGAHSEEHANHLCRFVRRALAIMQINLSHDRVWELVKEAIP